MLFNSYAFVFLFLPVVLVVFYASARLGTELAASSIAIASVVFYSWFSWRFTPILLLSITGNYLAALAIGRCVVARRDAGGRAVLATCVGANLCALGYFKYMNFFVDVAGQAGLVNLNWTPVLLPIGISFFTFTQIAYLVDTAQGRIGRSSPIHYLLFVTYFPHLIAGPILHHSEMMPQFRKASTFRPNSESLCIGATMFAFGLLKKVFVADSLATFANLAFDPNHVASLTTAGAWRGTLAYTLQIYFDFSAYCDMAIGVSRMFNVVLPANFESPYKSLSIIDFWRRWHMTLSRFLRDYLYIPLGGNKRGKARRYTNLMATMLLGGLWHGAGWNFLVWGALHGGYLCANHAWSGMTRRSRRLRALPASTSWAVTFVAVMVAWVFFRAPDLPTAMSVVRSMAGLGSGPPAPVRQALAGDPGPLLSWATGGAEQAAWLACGLAVVLALPNLRQVMGRHVVVLGVPPDAASPSRLASMLSWQPDPVWAIAVIGAVAFSVMRLNRVSQFLYFQF